MPLSISNLPADFWMLSQARHPFRDEYEMPGGHFFAHVTKLSGGASGGHSGEYGATADFHKTETVGARFPFSRICACGESLSKRGDIRQVTAFSDL